MKDILKEALIMLLLLLAIVLILAIIFYDYNPMNKEIPKGVTYQMPSELSDVKEELSVPLMASDEKIIMTYELTENDLDRYKRTNYNPGKVNPFELYDTRNEGDENPSSTGTVTTTTNKSTSTATSSSTSTSSEGTTFFQNKFSK